MAKLCLISCLSLTLTMSALLQNPITKDGVQMTPSILGVYLYSVGQYSFNVTEARSACESLGVTIATKSQVSKAQQNGLETCRYGWVDEQIAVIPRIKSLDKCGKNSTGLVVWRADHSNKFDVFCFNSSDPLINVTSVTTQTSVTAEPTARETRSLTAQLPSMTSVSLKGPRSSPTPETQSPFLTTTSSSMLRSTTVSKDPLSQGLLQSPFTALPLALFVITGILLLTATAGVVWYCRRHKNVHPFSNKEPPKENIETEVWKQNNRDEEHQDNQLETDLDKSRKNSQDLHLEVEPEAKAQ